MTKREAAIVTIFTGMLIGEFSDAHKYVEELMGRPVWTHEFGDERTVDEMKELAKQDFISLSVDDKEET